MFDNATPAAAAPLPFPPPHKSVLADFLADDPDPQEIERRHRGLWSPVLRDAIAYWEAKRRGRRMPARADIDPLEMQRLLPNLVLVDVLGTASYRYRLVGTAVADRLRADGTGRPAADSPLAAGAAAFTAMYDYVAAGGGPAIARWRGFWTDVHWINATAVVLPLSPGDGRVTMMLGAMDFWSTPRPFSAHRAADCLADWKPLILPPSTAA
jgi:hypothetical protein